MKLLTIALASLISLNVFANFVLESGDYGVYVQDRHGRTHSCTFNIHHDLNQDTLLLNILDCPPNVINVTLYSYNNGSLYQSAQIPATTDRGGYMMYEIRPVSNIQFEMTTHRVYGDGGVNRPRAIVATKR
jgi:hypothetical protein